MQVDRQKVLTKGKDVVGELLISLQVYKSTADGPGARKFYTELTTPLPGWDGQIRDLVLKKKLVSMIGKSEIRFWLLYSHERSSSSQEQLLLMMMKSNSKNTLWRLLGSLRVSSIANCEQRRPLSSKIAGNKREETRNCTYTFNQLYSLLVDGCCVLIEMEFSEFIAECISRM